MKYVGIDLHKQIIVVCVVNQERKVLERNKFRCLDTERIREHIESHLDEHVGLERLAATTGLSVRHVLRRRIDRVREMLKQTDSHYRTLRQR